MLFGLEDLYLDHVAVAVNDLEASVKVYEALGLKFEKTREVVQKEKVTTAFAAIDSHAHLELLEPLHQEGAIQNFIDKKGAGIHHLCFRVKNLKDKMEELKKKGFIFLYPEGREGANGALVNFIHPKSTGGVLVELSEKEGF